MAMGHQTDTEEVHHDEVAEREVREHQCADARADDYCEGCPEDLGPTVPGLGILRSSEAQEFAGAQEIGAMTGEDLRFGSLAGDEQDIDVGAAADDVFDRRSEKPASPGRGARLALNVMHLNAVLFDQCGWLCKPVRGPTYLGTAVIRSRVIWAWRPAPSQSYRGGCK
jgi:hypothetical protein